MLEWLAGLVAVLSTLVGGWFVAKNRGREEERADQQARERVAEDKAREVGDAVDQMDDAELRGRAERWVRDER